jgi:DNA-binding HxlR family transcriptional regulator
MLSQELKVLEMNKRIKQTLHDRMPATKEYYLTQLCLTLDKLYKKCFNGKSIFFKEVIVK